MINYLIGPTRNRVIREIKKILYNHPRYRADSENVYSKFSFESRPQRGVIVNGVSADRVRLSADNYMGCLSSFCMLTPVGNHPNTTLEWIRENSALLEQYKKDRSIFPSPPGVYILEVTKLPDDARKVPGTFTVTPTLTVTNEPLITFSSSSDFESQLSHENIYPGSLRLWLEGRRPLLADVDYHIDYTTGEIIFLKETPADLSITADYRYETGVQGPFTFMREESNMTAIPGVVLAFGDRVQDCDKMAIVITEDRTSVANVFGGKFEVNFELVSFAKDSDDRSSMSDYITISMLEQQNKLGFEGLELMDISPGGESEEIYNQESDEYYYEGSISMTMRVDWEIWVPLPVELFRAEMTSKEEEEKSGYLDGSVKSDLLKTGNNIDMAGISTLIDRRPGFERIK